jgi:large subunit ribosomal protein L6
MSRVGKHPVPVPQGVTVQVAGRKLTAKGKKGELSLELADDVDVKHEGNLITVTPRSESKRARTLWGTSRANINNLVKGVADGFTRRLEIQGVGYRAAVEGNKTLVLQLGYSHEVRYPIPQGIEIKTPQPTVIDIAGADRQRVGQTAAVIRSFRKPEPYKGKGIRYAGEFIIRKEGKKK